jgi:HAD superfamily hydrolase (TIGR01450 family)
MHFLSKPPPPPPIPPSKKFCIIISSSSSIWIYRHLLRIFLIMLIAPSTPTASCAFVSPTTSAVLAKVAADDDHRAKKSQRHRRSWPSRSAAASESDEDDEEEGVGTLTDKKPLAVTPQARPPTSTLTKNKNKYITGIRDIADDYDVFLLDLWGVLLDGSRPYDGVLDALQELRRRHKRLIVLSNSSKRLDHSLRMLRTLGFDPTGFETVITSGEVAHQMLSGEGDWLQYCQPWMPLASLASGRRNTPRRAFCLGSGDGDAEYLRGCGWALSDVNEADLIVARGTFTIEVDGTDAKRVHKRDDPTRYEAVLLDQLQRAASRRVPMLVCNPDKVRPDRDRPPMPGQLGDLYESMLLREANGGLDAQQAEALVKRVGKPDPDVYAIALQQQRSRQPDGGRLSTLSGLRACMVGDALETDVTGGSGAGLDTIWVLDTGIHGPDLAARKGSRQDGHHGAAQSVLDEFNRKSGTYAKGRTLSPTRFLPSFRW